MKEYSIKEIHKLMEAGELTTKQLVQDYLSRIQEIDQHGPELNAIIEINPEVEIIADKIDEIFNEKGKIGPLHGIPVLIKDNIDTVDQMKTTAGSITIEQYGGKPKEDAHVVQLLRDAGAIILGKTNLSEMANFRGERSTSGWSSRGGRTKNPYVLNRNPSGSSSGSAVAVAANLCTVSIGTETDGSVISPAQTNGIVGIKPSIGLVSRSGIIPIAASQDTAGPMARTVEDAAILLEAMVGKDPKDPTTEAIDNVNTNYTSALSRDGLKNSKIGVLRESFGFHKDVDQIMEDAIQVLEDEGAELIDPVEMEYPEEWGSEELTILLYEYKEGLNTYFATRKNSEIETIDDLIRLNQEDAENTMPFFGQELVEKAAAKGDFDEDEYQEAMEAYEVFKNNLTSLLKDNSLDAIIAPSGGPAWVTDYVIGDHFTGGSSQLAAVSGYCNITVPAGYIHDLPVGINFIGGKFKEKTIIKLAYAFEQATQVRQAPEFKETIER